MKKRLLSLLLAVAVVMTYAASAFAATPADVKGTDYQSAVEELAALGVLNGYPDGTFKPTNTITRAELAKVVVVASGNESAATLMAKVKPTFKDVKANQWFTGYVNVAATKGLIKGDAGTKNFRPNDKIKFEEVVAVLIRALGYQDSKLNGAWPYNVILKAQDIGLLDGVDITAGTLATRGVVALLTSNTINEEMIAYDKDGIELVGAKLVTKVGNTADAVLSAPTLNSDKKISLDGSLAITASNFVVTGGKTLADLLGHKVTVTKTKDNTKVLAITDAQAADRIVAVENDSAADAVYKGNTITVKNGVNYTMTSGTNYFGYSINYDDQPSASTPGTSLGNGAKATLFLNAVGNVQYVLNTTYVENQVVASYDVKTSYRDARVNFKDTTYLDVLDSTSITLDGKAASASDLKEFDVVRFVKNAAGKAIKIEATRNAVTGKVTAKRAQDGKNYATIGGKEYEVVAGGPLTVDTDYTVLFNKDGQVVFNTPANAAALNVFGVILEPVVTGVGVVKDGAVDTGYTKLVYFSVKENKKVTGYTKAAAAAALADNDIVKFTFDSKGEITTVAKTGTATGGTAVASVSASSIKIGSNSYVINSNTVVVDATKLAADTLANADLSKIQNGDYVAIGSDNNINANVIVLISDADATSTTTYGLYVSRAQLDSVGSTTYTATLKVKGTDTTYTISQTEYNKLDTAATDAAASVPVRHVVSIAGTIVTDETTTVAASTVTTTTKAQLPIANVSMDNRTFNTANGSPVSWIVTGNSAIYVVDVNGAVAVGSFSDIRDAANRASEADATVTVFDSANMVGGTYHEAAVVIVKKNV